MPLLPWPGSLTIEWDNHVWTDVDAHTSRWDRHIRIHRGTHRKMGCNTDAVDTGRWGSETHTRQMVVAPRLVLMLPQRIIMCWYGRSHGLGRSHGQMRHASIIREHLRSASKRKIPTSLIVKQVMVDASVVPFGSMLTNAVQDRVGRAVQMMSITGMLLHIWSLSERSTCQKIQDVQSAAPMSRMSELPPAPSSHPRIPDSSTCLSLPLACALSRLRSNW